MAHASAGYSELIDSSSYNCNSLSSSIAIHASDTMLRRLIPISLLSLLSLSGCVPPPPPTTPTRTAPEIGCFAPDLGGTDTDGIKIRLADHHGKVIVVDFWASWCGPCKMMIPQEKELVARMQGRPFVFLAVSSDHSKDVLLKFLEKDPHPWPDIYDGDKGPLAGRWQIDSWPTFFIIDAKGVIRHRFEGGGPNILEGPVEKLVREAEGR